MDVLVRRLFQELADVTPAERRRILAERQIAPDLRAEIEALLSFDSSQGRTLEDRVSRAAEEALRSSGTNEFSYCGPYRLIRLLGSGGMGTVYLAERSDGEIQQKVAIKLLRADADRPAWHERFLRERQLLANLNHPSIARVMDAGHTSDGRPYLVMEYVDGVPIDEYAARLDLRDQLALFLPVGDGISHAHRQLIIHRDLKPSNILVDVSGQPKLLDFGIAKLLDETRDATQTVERLLTPNYASPEQVRGGIQTTATDVYSLGCVLYKLLTGRSPHEQDTASSPKIPTDIDYILRKALRHEPEERYASVDAFANDVRAFLEWRPVQARSGDTWYRTRKFLRRYWVPVVAAALVLASLSAGLWVANRERAIAQRRFIEVRQLANKLFDIDVEVRRIPGTTKARQLIVDTSLEYLRRLAVEVRGDPELALEVGNAYMRVARVQGVPIGNNLGQMDQAEQSLQTAETLVQSVLVAQSANRTALFRSAQIAHDRMILAGLRRPADQALNFAQKSAGWLDKYVSTGRVDPSEAEQVAIVYMNVGNRYVLENQVDEGIRLCRRAIDIARSANEQPQAGAALIVVATAYRLKGELDAAFQALRESTRILESWAGTSQGRTRTFSLALSRQAEILNDNSNLSLGRSEEAVVIMERAYRIAEDLARQDPDDSISTDRFASTGLKLAGMLRDSNPGRAVAIYDQTLRRLAGVKNNSKSRRDEVRALAGSSYPLRRLGRYPEARSRLDAALSRLSQLKLYPAEQIELGSEADDTLRALADHEAARGKIQRAVEIYQELLDKILAGKPKPEIRPDDAFKLSNLYRAAAMLHLRTGRADLASALQARRLELWRHWDRKLPYNVFIRRQVDAASSH